LDRPNRIGRRAVAQTGGTVTTPEDIAKAIEAAQKAAEEAQRASERALEAEEAKKPKSLCDLVFLIGAALLTVLAFGASFGSGDIESTF